jgi:hypothetical protein
MFNIFKTNSIMTQDLVFVTAQPDVPYFIWQIKLYVHNFIEKGIDPNQIHVVLGLVLGNTKPSEESLKLKDFCINVHALYIHESSL